MEMVFKCVIKSMTQARVFYLCNIKHLAVQKVAKICNISRGSVRRIDKEEVFPLESLRNELKRV